MFTCPSCNSETPRLIAAIKGLVCPNCYTPETRTCANLHIHNPCGPHSKNLTYLQAKHIQDRTISADGKRVVCKSNPNRIWSW